MHNVITGTVLLIVIMALGYIIERQKQELELISLERRQESELKSFLGHFPLRHNDSAFYTKFISSSTGSTGSTGRSPGCYGQVCNNYDNVQMMGEKRYNATIIYSYSKSHQVSITRIESFLEPDECRKYIEEIEAANQWKKSVWYLSLPRNSTNSELDALAAETRQLRQRSSEQTPHGIFNYSLLTSRLAYLFGFREFSCSCMIRYKYGDYLSTHYDGSSQTVLIYFNNVPSGAGGATCFEDFGACFQPRAGVALWWSTSVASVRHMALMKHSSSKIVSPNGIKYVMNCFLL